MPDPQPPPQPQAQPPPPPPSIDLSGRVVLVTGGTRGIGRGITAAFLAPGCEVTVCGRTAPEVPVPAAGREAAFVSADVRDPLQAAAAVDAAVDLFGRLDIVVNNAGG